MTPRTQLLHAAATEFALHGFDGATFAGIASRLDKARSYVQHYAASKLELAQSVLDESMVDGDFLVGTRILTGGVRQLRRFCEVAAERYAADIFARAALRLAEERPEMFALGHPFQTWQAPFAQLLREAVEDGDLVKSVDVECLAADAIACFAGAGVMCAATATLDEMPRRVRGILDSLLAAHASRE